MSHIDVSHTTPTMVGSNAVDRLTAFGINDADQRRKVTACAKAIHAAHRDETNRIFQIGRELLKAKGILRYPHFGTWLENEFSWSQRTAERYMQAVNVFGGETDTVSNLGPAAIYALSAKSTPEAVRKEVVAQVNAGHKPSLQAVKTKVAEAKKAAQVEKATSRAIRDLGQPLPAVKKRIGEIMAQRVANLILESLGTQKASLTSLLKDVDATMLVAALLKGEIVEPKGPVSELVV